MRVEAVTSAQNPKIKTLLALQEKARLRKEMGLFVVEGRRELEHCIEGGFEIDTVFICPEIYGLSLVSEGSSPSESRATLGNVRGRGPSKMGGVEQSETLSEGLLPSEAKYIHVTRELYDKVAYRGGTEGIIAEVKVKQRGLEDIAIENNPLIVVLEGVEKPGNLGAVLRSADAAGADAVLICDPLTDLFNPNLIRSSIGAVFTVPVVCCTSEQAIAWLKAGNVRIYTAQLQDSEWYYDTDMKCATAIAIGTEATGLTDVWRKAADAHIKIPMLGKLDSLNASVSAAILLFEAVRQRNV